MKSKRGWVVLSVILIIAILVLIFWVAKREKITGNIITGEAVVGNCDCLSCDDCNQKLKSTCKTVSLIQDIEAEENCITYFDGKTFDCQGNKISGKNGEIGIELSGGNFNTIQNCKIENFVYAVKLSEGEGNKIINNSFSKGIYGLWLEKSRMLTILDNNFFDNDYGMYILKGDGESVSRNLICNNKKYDVYILGGIYSFTNNRCKIVNKLGVCDLDCNCQESWKCSDWSSCTEGKKTRTCQDENNCRTSINKPVIQEACTAQPAANEIKEKAGNFFSRLFCKIFRC